MSKFNVFNNDSIQVFLGRVWASPTSCFLQGQAVVCSSPRHGINSKPRVISLGAWEALGVTIDLQGYRAVPCLVVHTSLVSLTVPHRTNINRHRLHSVTSIHISRSASQSGCEMRMWCSKHSACYKHVGFVDVALLKGPIAPVTLDAARWLLKLSGLWRTSEAEVKLAFVKSSFR